MKRLVYLSPVRWTDFAQRPHKFAEWHHECHDSHVLWLEPYPTRFPRWQDLRRLRGGSSMAVPRQSVPEWIELVRVRALPLEPLPGGTLLNEYLWNRVLARVRAFASKGDCELVIGKPSQLALRVLRRVPFARTVYDAMDDFPAFHRGWSSRTVASAERDIARHVDVVWASSSRLVEKFSAMGAVTALVRNACDPRSLPDLPLAGVQKEQDLVGYVGTLASWFDWELVIALARARPQLRFRLIGPLHVRAPAGLPPNIELLPACAHPQAMQEMARFAVGLIPFRHNRLTDAVDPLKYYEYRALGIPVVSSPFGEMPAHAAEDRGVVLTHAGQDRVQALEQALGWSESAPQVQQFRATNSWAARFCAAKEVSPVSGCGASGGPAQLLSKNLR